MTMRIRNEFQPATPKLDLNRRYRYTWPGQQPRVVSGAELATICQGADASMLSIEDITGIADRPTDPTPVPDLLEKDEP